MAEDKDKNLEIRIHDGLDVGDCANGVCNMDKKSRPKGLVEIYDEDGKIIRKSNLVTYQGREWLLIRALNYDNDEITPTKSEFITWFGVGTGGVLEIDPFDPIPPANADVELNMPVMINAADSMCGDYRETPVVGYYKHPFDSIVYEEDNENLDRYLIAKITITLGPEDANNNLLSEAGLYTANSGAGGYSGGFNIYARVTFPSVMKYSTRTYVFVWYLYM